MRYPTAHTSTHDRREWVQTRLQQKKDEVLTLYFEEGLSEGEVVRRTAYSASAVAQMIREEKRVNPTRADARVSTRFDRRRSDNRTVLSATHAKLGVLMARFIALNRMNAMEFGLAVNMTRCQVSEALAGYHDFSLTEMQRICTILQVEIQSVFQGMHHGPVSAVKAHP